MIGKLLKSPILHFVSIGALLYLTQDLWNPALDAGTAGRQGLEIVVAPTTLAELHDNFRRTTGREATAEEERAMVRDYADQEILYREALARGLDKADRSVKWRLVQKMRFLEGREEDDPDQLYREALDLGLDRDDIVIRRLLIEKMRLLIKLGAVSGAPDRATLADFYDKHAEDYRQPARVSLRHVFLSSDRRKQSITADANALLERIHREDIEVDDAIRLGDVFALGHAFRNNSEHNLAKLLGPEFAKATVGLSPGSWYGPIPSAYGLHLVWVDERRESTLPGLEPVRNQVLQRYLAELREAELAKTMEELRRRYAVIVEPSDEAQG